MSLPHLRQAMHWDGVRIYSHPPNLVANKGRCVPWISCHERYQRGDGHAFAHDSQPAGYRPLCQAAGRCRVSTGFILSEFILTSVTDYSWPQGVMMLVVKSLLFLVSISVASACKVMYGEAYWFALSQILLVGHTPHRPSQEYLGPAFCNSRPQLERPRAHGCVLCLLRNGLCHNWDKHIGQLCASPSPPS
jgi:hypothetical protein